MDKLYTIQEVATKLNLADKTLRRWEEAGKFTPSRTLGNQRRYTLEDLQILDAIKHGTVDTQKDLLNLDQASKLCAVSPTTMLRYEDSGKIHPIITSGNTYYPRQKLMEKMDELKKSYVEPKPITPLPVPVGADYHPPVNINKPKLSPLIPRANHDSPLPISPIFINIAMTIILIATYHFLFNQPSAPISPQGSVQGVSTITTPDPRLDDLITKFNDHLSSEMLKAAKPQPLTNTYFGTATLPKNQNQIFVPSEKITSTSAITATFTSDFSPAKKYWVIPGTDSFTLYTDFPVGADSTFNYSFLAPTASSSAHQAQ